MDIVLLAILFPLLGLAGAAFREMNERDFETKVVANATFRVYLFKQLIIGAVSGGFMLVTLIGLPVVTAASLISAFSVGYMGSSFIENFLERRAPKVEPEALKPETPPG